MLKDEDIGLWKSLYNDFMSMDDEAWDAVDMRLAQSYPAKKVEEIQKDFVSFTRFVWGNVIDLRLDIDDSVIDKIVEVQSDNLPKEFNQENLNALRPAASS